MIDLASATHDELVAEIATRLNRGEFGVDALIGDGQRDHKALWSAWCAELARIEARYGWAHPVVTDLRATTHRLVDERPDALPVIALATTRYGREDRGGE